MLLKLNETLTDKEIKQFKIPNTLEISNFNGVQFAMCLGAIYRDNRGKYQYNPEYSKTYIDTDIHPNKLISFCELHKDIIIKDKVYMNGHFTSVYYIVYSREEKPMLINEFNHFNHNLVDIEVVFNDNGFYRLQELHLDLSQNITIIGAIESLFSNENIDGLPFITTDNDNHYHIEYYDEYGRSKFYVYPTLLSIFNCITSIRLVGCKEVGGT